MRGVFTVLLVCGLAPAHRCGDGAALGEDAALQSGMRFIPVLHSPCGRIEVRGDNALARMAAAQWMRALLDSVKRSTGADLPFSRQKRFRLDLVVRTDEGIAMARVLPARITLRDFQRLVLVNYSELPEMEARSAACRIVLNTMIVAYSRHDASPRDAPPWLYRGLARLINPETRAQSTDEVLGAWRHGRLSGLGALANGTLAGDSLAAAAGCVLLGWMADLRHEESALALLCQTLATGAPISAEVLAEILVGDGNVAALEEAWDRRLLLERRIVYRPGSISEAVLSRFRSALLLYPGHCAIPLNSGVARGAPLVDVLHFRDEKWVPAFAMAKMRELNVIATGQGERLHAVVERFSVFLGGLARGEQEVRLKELLDSAYRMLAGLTEESETEEVIE